MNPTITNISDEKVRLTFRISNINVSLANSIRRVILSDIPNVVFRTSPHEKNTATIHINTSRFNNEIVKPGKGQAFNRVKFKDLITGKTLEKTFKSGESLEAADVMELEMQYLYTDGEKWYFMDPNSFDQFDLSKESMGSALNYLVEQDTCIVTLWNNNPISVSPPNHVTLEVIDTDPGLKGDTAGTGGKPATLNTGVVVQVPLFVAIGDRIKVDTRTNEYTGRA